MDGSELFLCESADLFPRELASRAEVSGVSFLLLVCCWWASAVKTERREGETAALSVTTTTSSSCQLWLCCIPNSLKTAIRSAIYALLIDGTLWMSRSPRDFTTISLPIIIQACRHQCLPRHHHYHLETMVRTRTRKMDDFPHRGWNRNRRRPRPSNCDLVQHQ